MQDILKNIQQWISEKRPCALATVTKTWGSSPRAVGSTMAVTVEMQVAGSVSGGCIEGAVIEESQKVLQTGIPKQLSFGVSNETAWSVGLTCGGTVDVFVERHCAFSDNPVEQKIWRELENALTNNRPAILLTRLLPEQHSHLLVFPDGSVTGDWQASNTEARRLALLSYAHRKNEQVLLAGEPVFINVFPRKDRVLIVGAAHISIPLVMFAKDLDFEVVVIDPRQVFTAPERFRTQPDHLYTQWPDEALKDLDLNEDTYAVLLTHDPKIDDVALHSLLKSDVRYIGALGSKKTHAQRCARLLAAGFSEEAISRIQGPAGLDIDAQNPTEIALSIIAQIIQTKRSRVKRSEP
ncbi:MAG: XdhC family protein [bacterium]